MMRKASLHRLSSTETMQVFKVVPVLLSLIYATASVTIWPTHTICKNDNLDVKYRSCGNTYLQSIFERPQGLTFYMEPSCSVAKLWPQLGIRAISHQGIKPWSHADPLQDLALSVDSCSYVPGIATNIRIATVLRYTISQLSVDISLTLNGQIVPIYTKQLCEQNRPQFQFCGKKKGEYIYYEGPVSLNMESIPQGEFNVTAQLFNGDRHTVICADFFIRNR